MSLRQTRALLSILDSSLRSPQCLKLSSTCRCLALDGSRRSSTVTNQPDVKPKGSVSKAMQIYMERAKETEEFMSAEVTKYEIGKRHLANMMGEDPATFTQQDIDEAIAYLLPSGLFDPRARPQMKHPRDIYFKRKEAEFDTSGRPFHSLFFTGRPAYYQVLQEIAAKASYLDQQPHTDRITSEGVENIVAGSIWVTKEKFEKIILEKVSDPQYDFFIRSMDRYIAHPRLRVEGEKEFIMKFREPVKSEMQMEVAQLMYTDAGIPYMTAKQRRKMAFGEVTVYGKGTGKFNINGKDILYFQNIQNREQVLFPLQFTSMLGQVDIVATVTGGGTTGQSGALRWCIANCLRSFVDEDMRERMRIAGLLTRDIRQQERKRPGQKGARAKFTWKAR